MLDTTPDLRVLGATIGFCVLSTAISGLGPAWRVTRPDVLPDLKEQPAQERTGRRLTMRNALVVGQIALSLALLVTAGLFMRGAVKAAVADPGFPLAGGVIVNVDASMAGYDETRGRGALRGILQRVRETPGVQSASLRIARALWRVQRIAAGAESRDAAGPVRPARPGIGCGAHDRGRRLLRHLAARGPARARVHLSEEDSASGPTSRDHRRGRSASVIRRRGSRRTIDPVRQRQGCGEQPLYDRRHRERRAPRSDRSRPVPHVYLPIGQHYRGRVYLHARLAGTGDGVESAMLATLRQTIRAADDRMPVLRSADVAAAAGQ